MGDYIYVRSSAKKNTKTVDGVKINSFIYGTKPNWRLWEGYTPYGSYELAEVRCYNLLKGKAEKAIRTLRSRGDLSNWLTLGYPEKDGEWGRVIRYNYDPSCVGDYEFDRSELDKDVRVIYKKDGELHLFDLSDMLTLVKKHTAFEKVVDFLQHNPTLEVGDPDRKRLADMYDFYMEYIWRRPARVSRYTM